MKATIHRIDFLHSGVNSTLICFINHYNTLKMKKELFLFVSLSVFITLIDLGAQIQGTQTRYTVVIFGLNQTLNYVLIFEKTLQILIFS